jgi:hypothetical protein
MRILPSARSAHADGLAGEVRVASVPSRCRRLIAVGAAALLLAGLGVGATAGPAHAAPAPNWRCANGFFANSHGHLTASECTGSGATDVYVFVSVLDETTGPEDVPATLYCTTFAYSSATGEWDGSCSIYSYS